MPRKSGRCIHANSQLNMRRRQIAAPARCVHRLYFHRREKNAMRDWSPGSACGESRIDSGEALRLSHLCAPARF
jgi:hypothetical protein